MQKRLISVGNGLALFIDKTVQKLLHLDANTIVNVETDGVRLVIEACGQRERHQKTVKTAIEPWQRVEHLAKCGAMNYEDARVAYFARATFEALEGLGISDEMLRRVYRGWMRAMFVRCWDCRDVYRTYVGRRECGDDEFRTMYRLEALLEAKKEGLAWDEAIEAALDEVPFQDGEESLNMQPLSPRPEPTLESQHNTLLPAE